MTIKKSVFVLLAISSIAYSMQDPALPHPELQKELASAIVLKKLCQSAARAQ